MLQPSATHLRAIIDGVVDGIIIADDEGRIEFANPAAESLFYRHLRIWRETWQGNIH